MTNQKVYRVKGACVVWTGEWTGDAEGYRIEDFFTADGDYKGADYLGVAPIFEPFATLSWNGSSVADFEGGVWWPNDEAKAEIDAAEDPAQCAIDICTNSPRRGEWHN